MTRIATAARLAGLFSLLTIIGGVIAEGYVSGRFIDFGNAASTAANIQNHSGTFYFGFALYMIEMGCQIVATAYFYEVFRPVDRSLNLASTFLELTGCVIKATSRIFFIVPLLILNGRAPYWSTFSSEQLQALSMILLRINDRGAAMALVFFGLALPVRGFLIYRSTFLPRFLGVLSMISSAGWLLFIYPPLGYQLFNVTALVALVASAVSIFWLLKYGVDERKWHAIQQGS